MLIIMNTTYYNAFNCFRNVFVFFFFVFAHFYFLILRIITYIQTEYWLIHVALWFVFFFSLFFLHLPVIGVTPSPFLSLYHSLNSQFSALKIVSNKKKGVAVAESKLRDLQMLNSNCWLRRDKCINFFCFANSEYPASISFSRRFFFLKYFWLLIVVALLFLFLQLFSIVIPIHSMHLSLRCCCYFSLFKVRLFKFK